MIICIFLSPNGIGSMLGLTVIVVGGAVTETGIQKEDNKIKEQSE